MLLTGVGSEQEHPTKLDWEDFASLIGLNKTFSAGLEKAYNTQKVDDFVRSAQGEFGWFHCDVAVLSVACTIKIISGTPTLPNLFGHL